ncbi:RIP metalloprotease RseP [Amphritea sp. HPY]|uniref:RIP metalloprotease RseP n=1 Tax=Amphritea sp. HPY TaxID=3421652 RepID=UPI003D7F1261
MEFLNTVLALVVTLGILVTIHEYGHFWVARRCGVKVLRFSVGFGKPLLSWRDKSGTEYVIALIPLGGYVSMLDEREGDVPDEQLSQAFNRKPVLQRIAVVAAGPLVNLAFAVFVYWAMFVVGVEKVVPLIDAVVEQSVAEQAGVLPGGELVSIGGRSTESWDEVNLALAAFVGEDREVVVEVRYPATPALKRFTLDLTGWQVDLENESPLMAVGIEPFRPSIPAVLGELVAGGQAELAGLRQGDRVTHIDDVELKDWDELVEKVQSSPQQSLMFAVENNGVARNVAVIPAEIVADDGRRIGVVGAAVVPVAWPSEMLRTVRYGVLESVPQAFTKTWQMISLTLDSIWKMLEGILSVKNLSGPITIAKVAGASAASGIEAFAGFLAYLSISLGILNLLPIPMLDGGHLLYYSVELFRGRPVSEKIQMFGLRIGMTLLFMLMGVAIFNDLMRL